MAFKMKGSPAKMGGIKGTSGHTSALKQQAEASALKQATTFMDKIKSAGSAIYDNIGKVHGHGNSNSMSHNIAKSYDKKKKEYRKAAKESSNKMKSPMEQKKKGETTTTTKKAMINTEYGGKKGDSQVIGKDGVRFEPKEVNVGKTSVTPTTNRKGRTTSTSTTSTNLLNPQEVSNNAKGRTVAEAGSTPRRSVANVETTKTNTKNRKNNNKKKSTSVTYNADGSVKGNKVQVTKYNKKGEVRKIVNKKATKRRVKKAEK